MSGKGLVGCTGKIQELQKGGTWGGGGGGQASQLKLFRKHGPFRVFAFRMPRTFLSLLVTAMFLPGT